MTVRCPACASEKHVPTGIFGPQGRMIRCDRCGTRWLARPYEGLLPVRRDAGDVTDAIVIENSGGSPPRPRLPAPVPADREVESRWRPRIAVGGNPKTIGGIAAAVIGIAFLWSSIVAALPGMSRLPAGDAAQEFQKVRSETVGLGGRRTLFVEGEIVNRSADRVDLPAIEVTLKSEAGQPVRSWRVTLAAEGLAAGRTIGFRSALASPPEDAAHVTLNFSKGGGQFGLQ
jgi:predicted Zn finger-like uncharacterized protein